MIDISPELERKIMSALDNLYKESRVGYERYGKHIEGVVDAIVAVGKVLNISTEKWNPTILHKKDPRSYMDNNR